MSYRNRRYGRGYRSRSFPRQALVILVILFPDFKRKNEENLCETGGEADELQE